MGVQPERSRTVLQTEEVPQSWTSTGVTCLERGERGGTARLGAVCRLGTPPAVPLGEPGWSGGVLPGPCGPARRSQAEARAGGSAPLLPIASPPAPSAACEDGGCPSPPHRGWTGREHLLRCPGSPARSSPTGDRAAASASPPRPGSAAPEKGCGLGVLPAHHGETGQPALSCPRCSGTALPRRGGSCRPWRPRGGTDCGKSSASVLDTGDSTQGPCSCKLLLSA